MVAGDFKRKLPPFIPHKLALLSTGADVISQCSSKGSKGPPVEEYEEHLSQGTGVSLEEIVDRVYGHPGRPVDRIAVSAGADGREGNTRQPLRYRQLQALPVGAGQQFWLTLMTAVPDRPYCVDDMFGRQIAAVGNNRPPGCQSPLPGHDLTALFQNSRPAGSVNGPVHAATPHKAGIGGVDDSVRVLKGNIATDKTQLHLIKRYRRFT